MVEVGELGATRDTYARSAGLLDMSSPPPHSRLNSPSLIWPNSLPPYHTSLACFILQPNRP